MFSQQNSHRISSSFFQAFCCRKGRSWEPFSVPTSVEKHILTKLDVKNDIFQKSVFSLSGSTILKDNSAWKSTKKGSKKLLGSYFLASCFLSSFWVAFGLHFGAMLAPQLELSRAQKIQKIEKSGIKNGHQPQDGPRHRSGWSWGGLWGTLGGSWGGLEGVWGSPGGHFGSVLGSNNRCQQRLSNSELRKGNKEKLEQQKAIEKEKIG